MIRTIRVFAASLVALASLASVSAFAQTAKPSPAAASKMGAMKMSKMSGMKMGGKSAKKMPARDPKTGRFMKAKPATKMGTKKPLPPRDAKGRFMKKTAASPAPK